MLPELSQSQPVAFAQIRSSPSLSTALQVRAGTVCAAAAEDYYTLLGVAKNADCAPGSRTSPLHTVTTTPVLSSKSRVRLPAVKTIKSAYRKLALKLHPDVNKAVRSRSRASACLATLQRLRRRITLPPPCPHPPQPDATAKFTQVKEAFTVLSDEDQRRNYDRMSSGESTSPRSPRASSAPPSFSSFPRAPPAGGGVTGHVSLCFTATVCRTAQPCALRRWLRSGVWRGRRQVSQMGRGF